MTKQDRFYVDRAITRIAAELTKRYQVSQEVAEQAVKKVRTWLYKWMIAHGERPLKSVNWATREVLGFPKVTKALGGKDETARQSFERMKKPKAALKKMTSAIARGQKTKSIQAADKAFHEAHKAWEEWGKLTEKTGRMGFARPFSEEIIEQAKLLDGLLMHIHNLIDAKIETSRKKAPKRPKWIRVAVLGVLKSYGDTERNYKLRQDESREESASALRTWLGGFPVAPIVAQERWIFYTTAPASFVKEVARLKGFKLGEIESGSDVQRIAPKLAMRIASENLGTEKVQQLHERYGFIFKIGNVTKTQARALKGPASDAEIKRLRELGITAVQMLNVEPGLAFGEPKLERKTGTGHAYMTVLVQPNQLITAGGKPYPHSTWLGTIDEQGKINVWSPVGYKPRGYREAAAKVLEDVKRKLSKEKSFITEPSHRKLKKNAPNVFGGSVEVAWSNVNQAWIVTWGKGEGRAVLGIKNREDEVFDYLKEIGAL